MRLALNARTGAMPRWCAFHGIIFFMSDFSHTIPLLAAALTAILAGCATTSAPSADSAGCEVPPAADEAECEVPPDTDEAGGQVVADSAAELATKPENGLPMTMRICTFLSQVYRE